MKFFTLLMELVIDVRCDKNEFLKILTDYENLTNYLPVQLKKIEILEKEGKLVRRVAFWKHSPHSDQLFSMKTYDNMIQQQVAAGKTKFLGVKIKILISSWRN